MLRTNAARTSLATRVALALLLAASAAAAQTAPGPQPLPPAQTFEREMAGGETHRYSFDLGPGEFFQARVEQKGLDVTLKLLDSGGAVLATMDSPNGKQGPETLTFVASRAGSLLLEVSATDAKAEKGAYTIRREGARTATARDRRRVEVERLFAEGMAAGGLEARAAAAPAARLSAAWAGWQELGDDYMAMMTGRQVVTGGLARDMQTAQDLLGRGQELSAKSKADSLTAREKLNEALKLFRSLDARLSDPALTEKASRLGQSSQETLNYLKALDYFSKLGVALSLNGIAQTYWNLGDWRENVEYLKLSLVAYEDAGKFLAESNISGINQKQGLLNVRAARAGALESLGSTLITHLERPEEALTYMDQALGQIRALAQETQDPRFKLREALTLTQMASAYASQSQNRKKAIEFLSKAIEVFRAMPDRKMAVARLLVTIGGYHSLDFDYEAALKNWDQALAIYRELDNKAGQTVVLQFEGTMYYLLDDKPKVREIFGQILSILQSPGYVSGFNSILSTVNTAGFEVFKELDDQLIEQTRLDRIGFAYERLEEYEKAVEYYEKSLAVARGGKDAGSIRGELRSISFVYTKLGKWDKAYEYAEQALGLSREGNVKEELAIDLTDAGSALLELGRPAEALKYQNEALALFQSAGVSGAKAFSPRYSSLVNELARTHAALGNRRMAVFYGKQGVNAVQGERQRLRNFDAGGQKGFLGRKEKHYRRLANWLIEEGRLPEAEQVLAMLKEDELLSYLRRDASEADKLQRRADLSPEERDALTRYDAIAERIAAVGAEFGELQELQSRGAALSAEQSSRFARLSKEAQDANHIFQAFLKQLADEFAARPGVKRDLDENLGLKSDLKAWGEGVVFLYTLVGEGRYRVILTTPKAQTDGKYEIKAEDLNAKIERFRAAVQDPSADPRPLGKELYDIIVKPIEPQLKGAKAKTLLWSLDGSLRLLPLAALWDGQQYFGQKYRNVTVTLASRTRMGAQAAPGWRALGLGVTQPKTVKGPNGTRDIPFNPLPAVKAELASIVRNDRSPGGVLPGQILLDSDFNQAELKKELLKGYQVVHIASHFSLNPGDATQSFLVMGDGQVLTVNELKTNEELSFEGVELLTLSACETAVVGKDGSGKEMEGFGYVAQRKGARAILATLWSVADDSTQLLMSEFYRLRQENPRLSKAEALQLAQRAMLDGSLSPAAAAKVEELARGAKLAGQAGGGRAGFQFDRSKPYSHPYFWSPFVLIGNWK